MSKETDRAFYKAYVLPKFKAMLKSLQLTGRRLNGDPDAFKSGSYLKRREERYEGS